MKNNLMIKNEISNKLIKFCKILNIVNFLSVIPYQIIECMAFSRTYHYYYFDDIPYNAIYSIFDIILDGTLDILLLSLYMRALHIYSNYWSRIDDKLIIKNEPNLIQHEILIIITRYCVVFTISCFVDIITTIFGIIDVYVNYPSGISTNLDSWMIFYLCYEFVTIIDVITYVIAMYSSYEFGYYQYRKFCAVCHKIVYFWNEKKALRDRAKKFNTFDGYTLMT